MAEPHASATPPSLTPELTEESLEFLRANHADRVEAYEIIRKIREGKCPHSLGPAAECHGCVTGDPKHYPVAHAARLKSLLDGWFARVDCFARRFVKSAAAL